MKKKRYLPVWYNETAKVHAMKFPSGHFEYISSFLEQDVVTGDSIKAEGAEELMGALKDILDWNDETRDKYLGRNCNFSWIVRCKAVNEVIDAWRKWKTDIPKKGEIWKNRENGSECLVCSFEGDLVYFLKAKCALALGIENFMREYERTGSTHELPVLSDGKGGDTE